MWFLGGREERLNRDACMHVKYLVWFRVLVLFIQKVLYIIDIINGPDLAIINKHVYDWRFFSWKIQLFYPVFHFCGV